MKLEVRRRIATGLVVCIQASVIAPRVAETASNALDAVSEMDSFVGKQVSTILSGSSTELEVKVKTQGDSVSADPTGGDPTGGDPTGGDPTGGDPTGGDPTGGDPTGGDPSGGDPELVIVTPIPLQTDESGESHIFNVSMTSIPPSPAHFKVVSTRPDEAQPLPASLDFWHNACIPQTVTVSGQNDGEVDGDIGFAIEFIDDAGQAIISLPGINADNDELPEVSVDMTGPRTLMPEEEGTYTVRVGNKNPGALAADQVAEASSYSLLIESTQGLNMTDFACTYLSGDPCNGVVTLSDDLLRIDGVDLTGGQTLLVSVDVLMAAEYDEPVMMKARFIEQTSDLATDDTESTVIAVFHNSFE